MLSGARKRISYDTIRREPLRRLSYNEFVPSKMRVMHTVDRHLALLAPLGLYDVSPEIHLTLPQKAKDRAAAVMTENDLAENFVILHPGSTRAENSGSHGAGPR